MGGRLRIAEPQFDGPVVFQSSRGYDILCGVTYAAEHNVYNDKSLQYNNIHWLEQYYPYGF